MIAFKLILTNIVIGSNVIYVYVIHEVEEQFSGIFTRLEN